MKKRNANYKAVTETSYSYVNYLLSQIFVVGCLTFLLNVNNNL